MQREFKSIPNGTLFNSIDLHGQIMKHRNNSFHEQPITFRKIDNLRAQDIDTKFIATFQPNTRVNVVE